ncbi:response regulator containing a CheY-like receiver domain and an HTH DNA-binding domain [Desulfitobacterium dehalogenans ATCC 51507]|uniref:Stage 0 sporulation protein A homolog n=1 Tax=Desulfitobacterium dehalogenans (strain ATCC 51507 / DSM 9161 / JW/IU-DC1) TaxID=756499 RepID=I4AAH7_DESDJ|nr:response regulator transcription factor [Desulfitobacterium dehalogenans]AFM00962.1 response regulator containing a CheY-like receiver domain and an HTH DNA-binding domain [Desulfitobacterium dehalogenans ATCC 51507]
MDSVIKVLVVDDHKLFAQGVVSLLSSEPDIVVTDVASSAEEGLRLVRDVPPHTVLLDINLPDSCGVDIISKIRQIDPGIGIVMLTGLSPLGHIDASLAQGASGFLLKNCTKEEMVTAIRKAAKGEGYFSQSLVPYLKGELVSSSHQDSHCDGKMASLTDRELEVFNLVVKGLRSKEIAEDLGIAKRTVDYHIGNILLKLEVKSRLEIVLKYKIG